MDHTAAVKQQARQERFGYVCRRCLRCCHHKKIQLNPYEVARLARNRGQTTTQFRSRHTVEGAGMMLKQTKSGACEFLGAKGCTVHPDRPLVCRLYPLGRHVMVGGEERFSQMQPHPLSEGEFTDTGTIADFLEEQEAEPFMQAADAYLEWFDAALSVLTDELDTSLHSIMTATAKGDDSVLDMDAAIADHCAATGTVEPADLDGRTALHLQILYDRLSPHRRRTT
ncbi:MAG: YkgJ family cysteine cluster protein [Alphaproteobacteria bacterium]|nr:YkgJ family cysteine cluster protein [Alphaproteobacteria bacterium]MDE2112009.1 YkgJ family cysteine cluster protein [Alphaproteobacteria bacterium]MDE2492333.1 YkgJ family cysteine cluster protein [Alphaproteobacteria bacterium]